MDPMTEALLLLLEQQVKHGDSTYSNKARELKGKIERLYADHQRLREGSGLRNEPTPPAAHAASTLDNQAVAPTPPETTPTQEEDGE